MRSKKIFWRESDAEQVRSPPFPIGIRSYPFCSSTASTQVRLSLLAFPFSLSDQTNLPYRPLLLPPSRTLFLLFSLSAQTHSANAQIQHATSGPFLALALHGPSAITHWRTLIGPTHVYKAQWLHPETLRARYGMSDTRNGFHGAPAFLLCGGMGLMRRRFGFRGECEEGVGAVV